MRIYNNRNRAHRRRLPLEVVVAVVVLLANLAAFVQARGGEAFMASTPRVAFAPRQSSTVAASHLSDIATSSFISNIRGGATVVDDDDEEEESDEEEEEEEEESEDEDEMVNSDDEEEDELDATLAAAAVKSTQKAKAKAQATKASAVKSTMSAKLAATAAPKKKKSSSSLLKFFRVPYILRACLNPFTVMSMTKHFWLSLVNLDYPPKVRFLRSEITLKQIV